METDKKRRKRSARTRSAEKITAALFAIMGEKPFSNITVTELCERAGVVRKTFYRNFSSTDSVVESKFEYLYSLITRDNDFVHDTSKSILKYIFECFYVDREFARVFVDKDLYLRVIAIIVRYVESALELTLYNSVTFDPMFSEYIKNFIGSGLVTILRDWVTGGFRQSPLEMAALSTRLLLRAFGD